jgi:hypothetical protein
MRESIQHLLPVDGNRYFTPYGLYTCKVIVLDRHGETLHIKVILVNERDGSQPARVYRIAATLQAIKKERLSLVMDIHKWALLNRDDQDYWVTSIEV